MAEREAASRSRRSAAAASTLLVVAAASVLAWVSAGPAGGEAEDPVAASSRSASVATSSTTAGSPGSVDTDDSTGDGDHGEVPDRFRLVYDVERNDGSRTERVYARDGRRWSFRDDESWFVHDGAATVRCAIGASCLRSVGPEGPFLVSGPWEASRSVPGAAGGSVRRIAGIPGRCSTYDLIGLTQCVAEENGLLLLRDPGADAMQPGPIESERIQLVSVGDPRETDFEPPSE